MSLEKYELENQKKVKECAQLSPSDVNITDMPMLTSQMGIQLPALQFYGVRAL